MVDPWKVPPLNAAPVNPVLPVMVVPLKVVPWKVPPVKAAPVNPVLPVMVVPLKVVPWKVPPVKAVPENPVLATINSTFAVVIFAVRIFALKRLESPETVS
jgi:hypothetical protein